MSDLLEALENKAKARGPAFQEVIDSLPYLSEDSLTEAEVKEACEALASHLGEGSFVMDMIRAKLKPMAKAKRTLKSMIMGKPETKAKTKRKSSKKKKD